jgi:hypothetical protein
VTNNDDEGTRDLLRKSYDMATQDLREAHHDEFVKLRKQRATELGVVWEPRLTAEQRAEQEFDRLLTEFPHLADRLPTAVE